MNKTFKILLISLSVVVFIFIGVVILSTKKSYALPVDPRFPDENFQQCIADVFDVENTSILTNEDFESLDILDCSYREISDIKGVELFTNLHGFQLDYNNISDLSPLSNMQGLVYIQMEHNNVTDLSPLKNLTGLLSIFFNNNLISDLSPLMSLSQIEILELGENNIKDISVLENFSNLESIDLSNNNIKDISVFANFNELICVYLQDNLIEDISSFENLTNLVFLNLDQNQITDVSSLSHLHSLEVLSLRDNNISDLYPLSRLFELQQLNLEHNNIGDIPSISIYIPPAVRFKIVDVSDLRVFVNKKYSDGKYWINITDINKNNTKIMMDYDNVTVSGADFDPMTGNIYFDDSVNNFHLEYKTDVDGNSYNSFYISMDVYLNDITTNNLNIISNGPDIENSYFTCNPDVTGSCEVELPTYEVDGYKFLGISTTNNNKNIIKDNKVKLNGNEIYFAIFEDLNKSVEVVKETEYRDKIVTKEVPVETRETVEKEYVVKNKTIINHETISENEIQNFSGVSSDNDTVNNKVITFGILLLICLLILK